MATCKECLHDKACGDIFVHYGGTADYKTQNVEMLCENFADKTKYVEQKHGQWENITGGMVMLGDCSKCKVRQPVIGTNHCKNCGAKMDGEV